MKILLSILLFSFFLFSESLEITADNFTHIESQKKAIFEGNAKAKEGKSKITANKFIVYFGKGNQAREYQAVGNVKFDINQKKQHVKGSCKKLIYKVQEETYLLEGNAKLVDVINNREMEGERLFLDNKNGKAYAKSNKKRPVKFIFEIKSDSKK